MQILNSVATFWVSREMGASKRRLLFNIFHHEHILVTGLYAQFADLRYFEAQFPPCLPNLLATWSAAESMPSPAHSLMLLMLSAVT